LPAKAFSPIFIENKITFNQLFPESKIKLHQFFTGDSFEKQEICRQLHIHKNKNRGINAHHRIFSRQKIPLANFLRGIVSKNGNSAGYFFSSK